MLQALDELGALPIVAPVRMLMSVGWAGRSSTTKTIDVPRDISNDLGSRTVAIAEVIVAPRRPTRKVSTGVSQRGFTSQTRREV